MILKALHELASIVVLFPSNFDFITGSHFYIQDGIYANLEHAF